MHASDLTQRRVLADSVSRELFTVSLHVGQICAKIIERDGPHGRRSDRTVTNQVRCQLGGKH